MTRALRAIGFIVCPASWLLAANVAAASEPAPAAAEGAGHVPTRHGSVFVDPLGFLIFGPTIGAEAAVGPVSATLYGRWFSVGLLAQSLFLNQDRHDTFDFSFGAGLRGRYYFWGGLAGPHVGVGLEVLSTRIEDHPDLIATNSVYLVPQVEGGYRIGIGSFFVGGAAALGYAAQASSSVDNLPGGNRASQFAVINESKFYGSASLDLGVYF